MSFIVKVILIIVVGDLVCWLAAHWLLRSAARPQQWRAALAIFFVVQLAGLALVLFGRTYGAVFHPMLTKPLHSLVYLWHLILMPPVFLVSVAVGVALLGVRAARRLTGRAPAPAICDERTVTRRRFLATAAVAVPAVLCVGAAGIALAQIERFRIRRFTLPLPQLPRELDGLTIAHVTDLHVGRFTEGAVLERIVAATNELRADLVLLTGDLINREISDLPAALAIVQRMRAAHGVFMCVGNHDLIEDGREFVARTRAAGVRLLIDESAIVEVRGGSVQLLGLPWGNPGAGGGRAAQHGDAALAVSVPRLLAQRTPGAFPILLAHHPHAFDFAADIPLTLAGHTHGGQLMVTENLGGGPALFRYWSGLYREGERVLAVSNGVGNWFPLRTRAPAEILHLTLHAARS